MAVLDGQGGLPHPAQAGQDDKRRPGFPVALGEHALQAIEQIAAADEAAEARVQPQRPADYLRHVVGERADRDTAVIRDGRPWRGDPDDLAGAG
jgi:hypothetical protein